jgi:hypothetical protein
MESMAFCGARSSRGSRFFGRQKVHDGGVAAMQMKGKCEEKRA